MQSFDPASAFLKGLVNYWWLILLFILLLFVLNFLKSAKFKGKLAEKTTSFGMSLKLDPSVYRVFNDLIIPDKKGETQIDHVVASKYGIFVIEVKNYNGWIFGNKDDAYWTQVIFKEKHRFQNPLRQNYRHIMALSEYLGIDKNNFHSVVFFPGDAEFKTEMPENVIKSGLSGYIKRFNREIISNQDIEKIVSKLSEIKKFSKNNHKRS